MPGATQLARSMRAMSIMLVGTMAFHCTVTIDASADQPNAELSDLRWDLAERFEFRWTSMEVSARAINGANPSSSERRLIVSAQVGIVDGRGLATIDVNTPVFTKVLDGDGDPVQYQPTRTASARCYQVHGWRWQSGMRLPWGWEPFRVMLRLSDDPNQPIPPSLSLLEGYIYVLYADDVIPVDVPFDPNGGWHEIEAAPDLRICVDPTTPPCPGPLRYVDAAWPEPGSPKGLACRPATPVPLYKYTTWVKSKSGAPVMALREPEPWFPRDLFPLGEYAVVRVELYDSERGRSATFSTQWTVGDPSGDQGVHCWGYKEQGANDTYDTIRHVIAVRPTEVRIPFVLKNIPVPSVAPVAK